MTFFEIKPCVDDVIKVLQKHNATVSNMKEVFKAVKKEISLKTPIHIDDSTN